MAARQGGSRIALYLGAGVAGVGGYYLYRAGGRPKLAEREAQHDAAHLSAKMKSELPGRGKELKTEGKLLAAEAGAKLDHAAEEAQRARDRFDSKGVQMGRNAERKLESVTHEIGREAHEAREKFDKTVEEGAQKAKSSWSSLFGRS